MNARIVEVWGMLRGRMGRKLWDIIAAVPFDREAFDRAVVAHLGEGPRYCEGCGDPSGVVSGDYLTENGCGEWVCMGCYGEGLDALDGGDW